MENVNHLINQSACLADRRPDFEPIIRARRNPEMLFDAGDRSVRGLWGGVPSANVDRHLSYIEVLHQINKENAVSSAVKTTSVNTSEGIQYVIVLTNSRLGKRSLLATSLCNKTLCL